MRPLKRKYTQLSFIKKESVIREVEIVISELETFNTNPELIKDEKDYIFHILKRLEKLKRYITDIK